MDTLGGLTASLWAYPTVLHDDLCFIYLFDTYKSMQDCV